MAGAAGLADGGAAGPHPNGAAVAGGAGGYLALQQEAGLPLADYDGQTVTRCTYTVTNYPGRTGDVQANLYLCGDVIVGGDIMALGENGFQASLLYPAENT